MEKEMELRAEFARLRDEARGMIKDLRDENDEYLQDIRKQKEQIEVAVKVEQELKAEMAGMPDLKTCEKPASPLGQGQPAVLPPLSARSSKSDDRDIAE